MSDISFSGPAGTFNLRVLTGTLRHVVLTTP